MFGFGAKKKPEVAKRRTMPPAPILVDGEWRFKPAGKLVTSWTKTVVSDLSRTSANMTSERELKAGDVIEVRMTLDGPNPVTLDAAIVCSEKVAAKFKIALAFRHVNEEASHVITRFVNRRMAELRGRGLV